MDIIDPQGYWEKGKWRTPVGRDYVPKAIPTIYCDKCRKEIPFTSIFAIQNADITYDLETTDTDTQFKFVQKDISELDHCEYGHAIYDDNYRWTGACHDSFSWNDIREAAGRDIPWE